MTSPRPRGRTVGVAAVAVALVVAVALTVVLTRGPDPVHRFDPGRAAASVPGIGGVTLSAQVFTPQSSGDHPLILMPVPFDGAASTYDPLATRLMQRGYVVVTYVQRGFAPSGGLVDLAGRASQQDVSAVLTWALGHTRAQANHVGVLGESYGAGIGLLAAAHDDRIRVVAAMSAWTDLTVSFDQNNTPSTSALGHLLDEVAPGRLDPSVRPLAAALGTPRFATALAALSPERSAQSFVDELNRNGTAVLIANAFQDSYFAPGQLVPFFTGLSTPKRLQLAPGDHGGPEQAGLAGRTNEVTRDATAWLDHFLRGDDNGIADEAPVQLTDQNGAVLGYPAWPGTDARPIPLQKPNTARNVGKPSAWSLTLRSGHDSGVDLGPFPLGTTSEASAQPAVSAWTDGAYARWTGRTLHSDRAVTGIARVQVGLGSAGDTATVYAYLCDVGPDGTTRLVTAAPYTATGLRPNSPQPVAIDLQPVAWTVARGHRLALVVDTADERYDPPTPDGQRISLSSTLNYPATATVAVLST